MPRRQSPCLEVPPFAKPEECKNHDAIRYPEPSPRERENDPRKSIQYSRIPPEKVLRQRNRFVLATSSQRAVEREPGLKGMCAPTDTSLTRFFPSKAWTQPGEGEPIWSEPSRDQYC